ncbi:MAG: aspartate dehydrogenase, partial [Betaproteobacteria bacterium]
MRTGIIGGGTIARLILEHIERGELFDANVTAILGRTAASRGRMLAQQHGVSFVTTLEALIETQPDVVVEAASHEAVRSHAEPILASGIALIVLSGGALCDDALRTRLEAAARGSGALLHVPSGGIGGL